MSIRKQSLFLGLFILASFMVLQMFILYRVSFLREEVASVMTHVEKLKVLDQKRKLLTESAFLQNEHAILDNIEKTAKIMNETLNANTPLYVILFINVVINLGLYLFSKRLVYNLRNIQGGLNSFFRYLRREGNKIDKIAVKGNDEFKEIAENINENIKSIEKNIQKDQDTVNEVAKVSEIVSRGDFSPRIKQSASNPEINQLRDSLNKLFTQMQDNLHQIVKVLTSYEKGDFQAKIKVASEGELKLLINGVNSLGNALQTAHHKIETSLKDKSTRLNSSAEKLQHNVKNLFEAIKIENDNSQKAARQMHEMKQKIQQTVQKGYSMKSNAQDTMKMAKSGEQLSEKTYTAMQDINASTAAISEAITAIDAIAFQTNILSLNAAVEAATAGDAGKGFAVVAQEVRNLAAKSSEAAKTIKELVETTREKTGEGMEISENMKENFVLVNAKIQETYHLIENVVTEAHTEEKMVEDIADSMKELQAISVKNSEVAKTTDSISGEILTIARDLQNEVETAKEEAEV